MENKKNQFDPQDNPKCIALVEQEDGNWKGWATRHGKLVEVRDANPETVLQRLLTHA